jgi:hypothetical protein
MSELADMRKQIYAGLTIAAIFCMYSFPLIASASIKKQSFITGTGLQSWPVPGDSNSYDNTIEVIGGGAGGDDQAVNSAGGPGGGGAYSRINGVNLIRTTSLIVQVGTGGTQADPGGTGGLLSDLTLVPGKRLAS